MSMADCCVKAVTFRRRLRGNVHIALLFATLIDHLGQDRIPHQVPKGPLYVRYPNVHPVRLTSVASSSLATWLSSDGGILIRRESPKSVIRSWQSPRHRMLAGFKSRSVAKRRQTTKINSNFQRRGKGGEIRTFLVQNPYFRRFCK